MRRKSLTAWSGAFLSLACGGSPREESPAPAEESAASATSGDACAALSQTEIEKTVGNPVLAGAPFAGPQVCKWETENPDHVNVLLTVRPKGSTQEEILCAGLRQSGGQGESLSGLGDVAFWKFSAVGTMFNSGDLEACGPRGFVSVSLNGKADEAKLKQAAVALVGRVIGS